MTTSPTDDALRRAQRDRHPNCVACGPDDPLGLGLRFATDGDGGVSAEFRASPSLQSYDDRVHGGVLSLVLDAAMTQCLFARGVAGVTTKLNTRFRRPVQLDEVATVRARITRDGAPLFLLKAEIVQGGRTAVSADAQFVDLAAAETLAMCMTAGSDS